MELAITAAKIDKEVIALVGACHKKATQILEDNIDKLHELADYLLEKETITGDEFMRILNNEDPEKAKSPAETAEVQESKNEESTNKEEN